MLEMGSRFTISRNNTPFIGKHPYLPIAQCDHWLNGDTHTGFQHYTVSTTPVIGNLGWFVHLTSYTMAGQFAYDSVTLRLTMLLYSSPNITNMFSCNSLLNTDIKRLFGRLEQLLHFRTDLAHTKRIGTVTIEAVKKCTAVNGYNITIFQYNFITRNSMNHHVIDRCADRGGKRRSVWIGEILERRDCSVVKNELFCNLIQLQSRNPRSDMLA